MTAPEVEGRQAPMDLREQRGALLRLALVVAAGLVAAELAGALATVLVVVSLLVMIVLHEFGHFVAAKRSGMKVTEFFVGFGPRLWAVTKGETTYGVKALPLGGYCRIIGMTSAEHVDPADEPRAYRNQSTWKRLVVAVAGSFVHFLLALIMLVVLFVGPGDNFNFISDPPSMTPIGQIYGFKSGPSPAQVAGLKVGDEIVAVNGKHFGTWSQWHDYLAARADQKVRLSVLRDGKRLTLFATLANGAKVVVKGEPGPLYKTKTGFLGVEPGPVRFGLAGAVEHAGTSFGSTVASSITDIGKAAGDFANYFHMLGSQKAADKPGAVRFVSVVGVVRLANEATAVGLSDVLYLLILINIFVGIFNLLPFLPMDGGHVAIALYEKARSLRTRRPYHADVNKMAPLVYAVLAVLAFYFVTSLFLDLRDLVS